MQGGKRRFGKLGHNGLFLTRVANVGRVRLLGHHGKMLLRQQITHRGRRTLKALHTDRDIVKVGVLLRPIGHGQRTAAEIAVGSSAKLLLTEAKIQRMPTVIRHQKRLLGDEKIPSLYQGSAITGVEIRRCQGAAYGAAPKGQCPLRLQGIAVQRCQHAIKRTEIPLLVPAVQHITVKR